MSKYVIVFTDGSKMTAEVRSPANIPDNRVSQRLRVENEEMWDGGGRLTLENGDEVEVPFTEGGIARDIVESR